MLAASGCTLHLHSYCIPPIVSNTQTGLQISWSRKGTCITLQGRDLVSKKTGGKKLEMKKFGGLGQNGAETFWQDLGEFAWKKLEGCLKAKKVENILGKVSFHKLFP